MTESRDQPTPWLTLECTVYEFLPLSFTYDRGICGFSVDYGRRKVPLARPRGHGLGSAEGLGVFLDDVIVAARERIPDKFLDARGW